MHDERKSETFTVEPGFLSEPPAVPRLPGRLRALRRLGRGGQGEVWLAEDRLLEQEVAVKIISKAVGEAAIERTRREAQLGRDLDSPHLVRVWELVDSDQSLLVVMEWMRQGSLREILELEGPLPVERVVAVAEAALEALAALHERGVIHRDVKVSNLLVGEDGRIKLGDLGLVRRGEAPPDLTRTGVTVGTPLYMSPEQLRGEELTPASDLYSLGVTLHRLLTGRHPFAVSSEYQAVDAHLHGRPEPVRRRRPDCPRWLAAFVRRLLEKRPSDRWPDANAALADFSKHRALPWRRVMLRLGLAAALLAAIAAAAATGAQLLSRSPTVARAAMEGSTLVAFDGRGQRLWQRPFAGPTRGPVLADVLGSPSPEVIMGVRHDAWQGGRRGVELVILGAGGETLFRDQVGRGMMSFFPPGMDEDLDMSGLWALDLGDDGRDEVLVAVDHRYWFPTALYGWPSKDGRVLPLLVNSGRCETADLADVDGDGRRELIVTGVVNPLGYQQFVAVLEARIGYDTAASPDLIAEWGASQSSPRLRSYALLGPLAGRITVEEAGPGGLVVRRGSETQRLSPWGVPLGSPAAAIDGERRMAYWRDIAAACREILGGLRRPFLDELARRYPTLWQDGNFAAAARLLVARSYAEAGETAGALAALEAAEPLRREIGDLDLRRGELLLIHGERRRGREAVAASASPWRAGRSPFDATLILGLDSALAGERSALDDLESHAAGVSAAWRETMTALLEPVFAFCAGAWNEVVVPPGAETILFPPVEVLPLWAGWRRGGGDRAELLGALGRLGGSAEHREVDRLLEADVRLRSGEVDRSESLAREALAALRRQGRTDYTSYFFVPLAELVYGEALLAQGDDEAARPHLVEAARLAPAAWFGEEAAARLAR